MDDELKRIFNKIMYELTKSAARESFDDFLESCRITDEEYKQLKTYLNETYGVKTFV